MHPGPFLAQPPDAELIRLTALGSRQAFASLYDRHRSLLFGLLLRILRSHAEAEDVLQEVFLEAWLSAGDFDETRGRAVTWLVVLARSRAIDRLRALATRRRAATVAAGEDSPRLFSDAREDAVKSEQCEVVRGALAALPDQQRHVLLLAYFEGLSQSQIAARLRVPLGTVKTRTRGGLMKLGELLRDPGHARPPRVAGESDEARTGVGRRFPDGRRTSLQFVPAV